MWFTYGLAFALSKLALAIGFLLGCYFIAIQFGWPYAAGFFTFGPIYMICREAEKKSEADYRDHLMNQSKVR